MQRFSNDSKILETVYVCRGNLGCNAAQPVWGSFLGPAPRGSFELIEKLNAKSFPTGKYLNTKVLRGRRRSRNLCAPSARLQREQANMRRRKPK